MPPKKKPDIEAKEGDDPIEYARKAAMRSDRDRKEREAHKSQLEDDEKRHDLRNQNGALHIAHTHKHGASCVLHAGHKDWTGMPQNHFIGSRTAKYQPTKKAGA
jgi:hypothetical protein